ASINVRVRQLVDERDSGISRQDGVNIHFSEHRALIFELFARNDFQPIRELRGGGSPVRLHDADYDILASAVSPNTLTEHAVSLANPGSIAQEHFEQTAFLGRRDFSQPLLRSFLHFALFS